MREREVAAIFGMSTRNLYTLRKARKIPYLKINSAIRYRESDITAFIQQHRRRVFETAGVQT